MNKTFGLLIILFLLLTSCAPSVSAVQTVLPNTEVTKPTQTAYPTYTIAPTYTPYPTYTQAPSQTARVIVVTPTNTSTPTLTPTPLQSPTPTQPPTNTSQPWQLTSTAVAATNVYLQQFEQVNVRDFVTYPDKFKNKKIKVSGTIFNVNGDDQFQIWISGTRDPAYIIAKESFDDLYENNFVTIYGEGQGENCGKNAYGGEVCQPLIYGLIIQK